MFQVQKIKKIKEKVDEGRQNSGQKGRMELISLSIRRKRAYNHRDSNLPHFSTSLVLFMSSHRHHIEFGLGGPNNNNILLYSLQNNHAY